MINKIKNTTKKVLNTIYLRIRTSRYIHFHGLMNVAMSAEVRAINKGNIYLGNQISCLRHTSLIANGGKLVIGDNVGINRNCIFVSKQEIVIGNDCAFGPNVVIYDHDHIYNANGYIMTEFMTAPVIIEDHCWIGANVTILRGSTIGKGSIIGAGTIIKGDIPAYSVVTNERLLNIKPIKKTC